MVALGRAFRASSAGPRPPRPSAGKPGAHDTILVVVQLTGGNDGLNTVIPFTDDDMPSFGRRSASRRDRFAVSTTDRPAPVHDGARELLEDSALCVVQGVGYPNPTSRISARWTSGTRAARPVLTEGWIGKALRHVPARPVIPPAKRNERRPLALTGAPVACRRSRRSTISSSPAAAEPRRSASADEPHRRRRHAAEPAASRTCSTSCSGPRRTPTPAAAACRRSAATISRACRIRRRPWRNQLKLAAQLIDAGLGARIFYVSIDGFDTHAGQARPHANLLREVSDAIDRLLSSDLAARGHRGPRAAS